MSFDLYYNNYYSLPIFRRVEIEHIHGQIEENPYLAATAMPRATQPSSEAKLPPTPQAASDSDSSS